MQTLTLPVLPYDLNALEPVISSETLQYHFTKHHLGYASKLQGLVDGTGLAGKTLEELIISQPPGPVFNNAAQVWNHSFYWNSMTPNRGKQPSPAVTGRLAQSFDSLAGFTRGFAELATGQFGSGWAWLVKDKTGVLKLMATPNAETPLRSGLTPLLVCDVWEHAYYIDYRNDRSTYAEKFIELINWDFLELNLKDIQ